MRVSIICVVSFCAFLAGCAGTTKEYVTVTEKVPITIPNQFLTKPTLSDPPSKEYYLSLTPALREKELANYINRLLNTIKDYSTLIDKISEYNLNQAKIVSDVNKKPKK